jgi:hypothetical protein
MKIFTIIPVVFCIILASCGSQRKIADTGQKLSVVKTQQAEEDKKLNEINAATAAKVAEGKIDNNISNRIAAVQKRFSDSMDAAKEKIALIDSLMANKQDFRKNYKSIVLPVLEALQKNNGQFADRLSVYMMIEDGLNIANYNLYDLAAFFGSGVYTIPDEKKELAMASFEPVMDSLIVFSNKYSDKKRVASVVILGFADAAGFSSEGPLFDTLSSKIGKKDASKEELNQKLSELRALELVNQLTNLLAKKAPAFKNFETLKIEYMPQGKGEAYPLPTIKDYQVDDSRRRIVLCYWVVLPE